jgi:UDP-glucose 4-epimerase
MESAVISNSVQNSNTYTIIRFHNIYGPGQQNHFIPEFIDRLHEGNSVLYGWEDTRSFCYIDDAIKLVAGVYNCKNQIINIGSNTETSILDVAHEIMDQMNIDRANLDLQPGVEGSTPRRAPDTTKLLTLMPKFKFTSLKEGLSKCVHRK